MSRVRLSLEDLRTDFPNYAATCLKIKDKRGHIVPFRLNYAQWKVERARQQQIKRGVPPRFIELKARQVGLSTHTEALMFHRLHLWDHQTGLVIASERTKGQNVFGMATRFLDHLPDSTKPETRYRTTTALELGNGSRFQVDVATATGGRSFTAQQVHLTEFAHYPDPQGTYDGVMQAVPDSLDSLVVIESTPKGLNLFHSIYVDAKAGRNDFVPIFIPWFEDPTYRRPARLHYEDCDLEERELLAKFNLTLEHVAWRRWCIRNKCRNDKSVFAVEYPTDDRSCFLLSGRPLFDREAMEHFQEELESYTQPPQMEIRWNELTERATLHEVEGGRLRIHKMPVPRHLYIAGVDPSEGDVGSDPTPIVMLDRMTLEPVAVWWGRMRPDRLAHVARNLCWLFNRAGCIWEANNHGLAFQIEFEKIWNDFYMREASPESVARLASDKPGFWKSIKTRHLVFDLGRAYINDMVAEIRDPHIVNELASMYYDDHDRPDHQKGAGDFDHDDTLTALFLCLEYHRGGDDNVLAPLDEGDLQLLLADFRRKQVAESMGISSDSAPASFDRFGLTANQIEELDEMEYSRGRRRSARGIGGHQ